MKHSGLGIPTTRRNRPLSFSYFIRAAAFLTLCISPIVTLLAALLFAKNLDGSVWGMAAFLTVVPIWVGTLTVGCLVMIPVWIWRLCQRISGPKAAKPSYEKQLWDQWMDGP